MPRFEIFSHNTIIGWSELESGDPPVCVAFGRFLPSPEYKKIKSAIVASSEESQEHLALSIRLTAGGEVFQPSGGIHITDLSAELGEEGMLVEAVGIAYPQYQQIFPEHISAYVKRNYASSQAEPGIEARFSIYPDSPKEKSP
jgi:hypothetical protein